MTGQSALEEAWRVVLARAQALVAVVEAHPEDLAAPEVREALAGVRAARDRWVQLRDEQAGDYQSR